MNTVHFSQDFYRLFLWSVQFLGVPPVILVTAICIGGVVVAFARQQPFRTRLWRPWYWLIFTQLLFFPAMVAIGVLFPAVSGWPHPKENVTGHRLLDGLFYFSCDECILGVANARIEIAFGEPISSSASHTRRGGIRRGYERNWGVALTAYSY